MMQTISLTNRQVQVLSQFKEFGFESEKALLNYAISLIKKEIIKYKNLKESAHLYCEQYKNNSDLQSLTEAALNDLY